MTNEVTVAALAAKIESLTSDVAAIEAGQARRALAAESGDQEAERGMVYGAAELQRLGVLIAQKKLALAAAQQRDREEAHRVAGQRVADRIDVETRIGHECAGIIAAIDANILSAVGGFQRLADLHAEYQRGGYALPPAIVNNTASFPKMVEMMLARSGAFNFNLKSAGYDAAFNGSSFTGRLADMYPPAEYFVQTKSEAA